MDPDHILALLLLLLHKDIASTLETQLSDQALPIPNLPHLLIVN